jgi:hypothetical protein
MVVLSPLVGPLVRRMKEGAPARDLELEKKAVEATAPAMAQAVAHPQGSLVWVLDRLGFLLQILSPLPLALTVLWAELGG